LTKTITLDRLDTIQVKCSGQGYKSNLTVTGGKMLQNLENSRFNLDWMAF